MKYFTSETLLDRIHAAKLPGFRPKTIRGFIAWQLTCNQRAESICTVTACRCITSIQSQFADGIQKQRELAYSGRFIGTRTFGWFRWKVIRCRPFIEWEMEDVRLRAQRKLCHMTRHGFSCYCDESPHACPETEPQQIFQRER